MAVRASVERDVDDVLTRPAKREATETDKERRFYFSPISITLDFPTDTHHVTVFSSRKAFNAIHPVNLVQFMLPAPLDSQRRCIQCQVGVYNTS